MPIYDYTCPHCGPFEVMRPMADYEKPAPCPQCGTDSARLVSAPGLALMSAHRRRAISINEQSAHAPTHSRQYDHDAHAHHTHKRHPKGCACCSSGPINPALTQVAANGNKSFPTKRPWMISH